MALPHGGLGWSAVIVIMVFPDHTHLPIYMMISLRINIGSKFVIFFAFIVSQLFLIVTKPSLYKNNLMFAP